MDAEALSSAQTGPSDLFIAPIIEEKSKSLLNKAIIPIRAFTQHSFALLSQILPPKVCMDDVASSVHPREVALKKFSEGVDSLVRTLPGSDQPKLSSGRSLLQSFVALCHDYTSVACSTDRSTDRVFESFLHAWKEGSAQRCSFVIEFAMQMTDSVSLFALLRLLECEVGYTAGMENLPPDLLGVWSETVPLLCRCIEMHVAAINTKPEHPWMHAVSLPDGIAVFGERVVGLAIALLLKAMRIKNLRFTSGKYLLDLIEDHHRTLGGEGPKLVEVIMHLNSKSLKKRSIDDWFAVDDKSDLNIALAVVRREGSCQRLLSTTVQSLIPGKHSRSNSVSHKEANRHTTEERNYASFSEPLAIEFLFALSLIGGLPHSLTEDQKIDLASAFREMVYRSPLVDEADRQMSFLIFQSILMLLKGRYSQRGFREINLELLLSVSDLSDQQVDVCFRRIRAKVRHECASSTVGVRSSLHPEGPFTHIPPELLATIFTLACPSLFKDYNSRREVLWLASVCQRWRALCRTTPRLWCAVVLKPRSCSSFQNGVSRLLPNDDAYPYLEAWLQRAGTLPKRVMLEGLDCHCYDKHHLASVPPIFNMLLSRGPILEEVIFDIGSMVAFNSCIASLPQVDDPSHRRSWDNLSSLTLFFNHRHSIEHVDALDVALQTLPRVERLHLVLPSLPIGASIGRSLKFRDDHMRVLTHLTLQSSWMGVTLLDLLNHLDVIRCLSLDFDYTHELKNHLLIFISNWIWKLTMGHLSRLYYPAISGGLTFKIFWVL
ncbi:hypothetical protein DFP72DRAFT_843827 [Ephemerocybe angulata]|uniref:F-box domain-containing protein n=1 Tax=Ephemerocybe angulata TaxID=980116 RepID=A0A8H6I8W9_9AGAR|nr:hypothetical protein DFP72DRAFT_843827 [Tulosesus angulatus]